MPKKPETRFKERVKPLLESLPRSWWLKTQERTIRGIPDFLGCINGHAIAIELKVDGEEADALQEWTLSKIIRAGGIGITVTPSTWDAAYRTLLKLALGQFVFKPQVEPAPGLDS